MTRPRGMVQASQAWLPPADQGPPGALPSQRLSTGSLGRRWHCQVRAWLTCVGHLHVSQRLECVLVGHILGLLGAHAVIHALGLLNEFGGKLGNLLGTQVPSEVVHGRARRCHVQGIPCAGWTQETDPTPSKSVSSPQSGSE